MHMSLYYSMSLCVREVTSWQVHIPDLALIHMRPQICAKKRKKVENERLTQQSEAVYPYLSGKHFSVWCGGKIP